MSNAAGPGEVLVTEAVMRLASLDEGGVEALDHVPLKGVREPVRLFRINAQPQVPPEEPT